MNAQNVMTVQELEILANLRDRGRITEAEYKAGKVRYLADNRMIVEKNAE